jgi:hypothetical protein
MRKIKMKNMKINIAGLLVLLFGGLTANAQFTNTKVAELEKFKSGGTVVVAISDDEETNKAAEEVMATYWKASKYKVIKSLELQAYLKANPENYVLTYLLINEEHTFVRAGSMQKSLNDPSRKTYTRRIADGLILAKNVKKVNKLEPVDGMVYTFIDPIMNIVDTKAEFIRQIGSMNAVLMYPNLKDTQIGGWKIPTIDYKEIIDKELWIADVDLNKKGKDEVKMKAAYAPYKYKIVSKEEIVKAITEKRKDVAYVACAEYIAGAFQFIVHASEDDRVLFFMGGTAGFDAKSLEKIKENKTYGQ